MEKKCRLIEQGFKPASCLVSHANKKDLACRVTLKWEKDMPYRLIKSILLSRPEHYLSIYQSGCNFTCLKCHSWEFSQYAQGEWLSPKDIARVAKEYVNKLGEIMYRESRERATSFHAQELCRSCGKCVLTGKRDQNCPGKLKPEQVIFAPQGFGPARNIIAFTGGDLACQPDFYIRSAEEIKNLDEELWVLFETNGYGLTPKNLDLFKEAGIDSFWLDIKAYDEEVHQRLTGASNHWILRLPEEILKRDFVLEVLSLYIPGWVEEDQIDQIAKLLSEVDSEIPFTILAFFPQYKLKDIPPPNLQQMFNAYQAAKSRGLKNVRLGNLGVFLETEKDYRVLINSIGERVL